MTIILFTLAVAFAAFCLWLTVRIVNRREWWAKWTLVATLALPVLYFASIGPACWISSRANTGAPVVSVVYRPLMRGLWPNEQTRDAIHWYSELGSANGWGWGWYNQDGVDLCDWELLPPPGPVTWIGGHIGTPKF